MNHTISMLLEWFQQNKRTMPWRYENRDPYHVWLSETMLQQTQVKTVIPYFNRFINRFPNIETLAEAPLEEVLKLWEGLGYYSRARNLHKGANEIVKNHQGVIPNDLKTILNISGIGPYTAGAILSLAYHQPCLAIDGNVIRVICRWFDIDLDMRMKKNWGVVEEKLSFLMPKNQAALFNEALMEFGAIQCKPQNPLCHSCLLSQHCIAFKKSIVPKRPYLKPKPKPKKVKKIAIIKKRRDQSFQILQETGTLLKGLWRLPWIDHPPKEGCYLGQVTHRFTHLIWDISVYEINCLDDTVEGVWIQQEEISNYPFSKVALKTLSLIGKKRAKPLF